MKVKRGLSVSQGYAVAPCYIISPVKFQIKRKYIYDSEKTFELVRFQEALEKLQKSIEERLKKISKKILPETAAIIEAILKIIQDNHLQEQVRTYISRDNCSAEHAIHRVFKKYIKVIEMSRDNFFLSRLKDLEEIEKGLLSNLAVVQSNIQERQQELSDRMILVAEDLTVSDTMRIDHSKIAGIITEKGGKTSHAAIISKELGIPAIVGLHNIISEVSPYEYVIVDGKEGIVILSPTEEVVSKYKALELQEQQRKDKIIYILGKKPCQTKDGVPIKVMANIEFVDEIPRAFELGAEGIGLFRTEFCLSNRNTLPTEQDFFEIYEKAVAYAEEREITIRILDLGADKAYIPGIQPETNPFLGCRGIRLYQVIPHLFESQIRAILKAVKRGCNVKLLIPMITTMDEVKQIKELVSNIYNEFNHQKITCQEIIPLGAMLEVPSAILTMDTLVRDVDFFSIGTNDLIQYLMAVDRSNYRVAYLYQPTNLAVIRLIKQAIDLANLYNKPISVCGEMAGEPAGIILLLGLGLKEFSMAPPVIPEAKKVICSLTMSDAKKTLEEALAISDDNKRNEYLADRVKQLVGV